MALNILPPVIPPYNSGVANDIKNAIANYFNTAALSTDDSVNYVLAFKSWLERRKLAFDEIIERYYMGEYNDQYPVALLGTAFDIYSILEAKDLPDEDKIQDLHGKWFDTDEVCEALGNINQMYYMNISFVDVVATNKSNISSSISEFKARCEILYGQVNAKVLEYQSLLASVLTDSHSALEALNSFMAINDVQVFEEPEGGVIWQSPASEITGANPFFAVIGMVDVSWNPLTWYVTARTLQYKALIYVIGMLAKTLYHVTAKAVSWINETFIDPKDIACVDPECFEPSFVTGYVQKKIFIGGNTVRTDLWNYLYDNHPGEYLRFVLPGATIYMMAIRDLDNGSHIDTYVKYHLYDLESIQKVIWYIMYYANPASYDIINIINNITELVAQLKPAPIGENLDDARLYQSMVLGQYLLNFSIGLLGFDYVNESNATFGDILNLSSTNSQYGLPLESLLNALDWAKSQGENVFNTLATRGIFSYSDRALDTAIGYGTITNYDFLKLLTNEGNPDHFETSQGIIFTHLCRGLFNILSIDVLSDETFVPYNFVCGPTKGRYELVPDTEHIDAVKRSLVAIAVVAAATILIWTGMRIRKRIRLNAIEARRTAELATYDPDITTKQLAKLNKKANRAERIAGISVPDVSAGNGLSADVAEVRKLISTN